MRQRNSYIRQFVAISIVKCKVKWEGAHHPYLQLGELNCEGRSSRCLVAMAFEGATALRSNVTEHSYIYDGRVGRVSILILNHPSQYFKREVTGVPGENPRPLACRAFTNSFHISVASPIENPRSQR